jgi:hypothetical protein
MPSKPVWLLHIPEILQQLEVFDVPVIDRGSIERLFGLRRRQAIELMHRFGGFQAARTFIIDRQQLIEKLRAIAGGEDFQAETERRGRLAESIEQLRRNRAARHVRIPVSPDVERRNIEELPAGVLLEPGQLRVDFLGAEDLLSKLYELSRAALNDYDRFRSAAEPAGTTNWKQRESN